MKTETPPVQISVNADATDDERASIIGGLVGYNDTHGAVERYRGLAIVARSGETIIGGLLGHTNWNWLFIRQLWIEEAFRGSGMGSRLLRAAEAEAIARGCAHAHCDTFEFQALPFYQNLGYEIFGQLEDYPPGFTRYFLQKRDLKTVDA
jgi:GNAT superfamily N-acetyltransferase